MERSELVNERVRIRMEELPGLRGVGVVLPLAWQKRFLLGLVFAR